MFGGFEDVGKQRNACLLRQVFEQCGGLFEEQRQVLFEAGGGDALDRIHIERALPRIDVEEGLESFPEAGDRRARQRVFVRRQQVDALDLVLRALGIRIEAPQRVDLVVEQVDAQRGVGAHGKQVDQRAAHGVFARLVDGFHRAIAGPRQALPEILPIEPVTGRQRQHAPGHVVAWRQSLHQGVDRSQYDPLGAFLQFPQRSQPCRDDVLVRREAVVGQRFPVGKRHHRHVGIEAQRAFEALRACRVRRHHQQWCIIGQARQRQRGSASLGQLAIGGFARAGRQRRGERCEMRHEPFGDRIYVQG